MFKAASLLKSWSPFVTPVRNYPYPGSFIQFLKNQPQTTVSMICNGITVASESRACSNVCVGIFADAGSRYECDFENGITHFFEHIVFKSTNTRNLLQLEQQMNCTGAKFRCFTERDMCGYYAECLTQDVPVVVDMLSDCVINNAYDEAQIEAQKHVVYDEMLTDDTDINVLLSDYLHAAAFQGTPLSKTVMGPSTNLYNWNPGTICRHLCKHFNPRRMVLAAVGGITHDQLEMLANTYLSNYETQKCLDSDVYRYTGAEIRFRNDALPMANCAMAVEAPNFCHQDKPYMQVASSLMGAWDSTQYGGPDHGSPVAEYASTAKFCEAYESFYLTYKDAGLWGVKFMATSMQQEDMAYTVQSMWMSMCTMMTEGELIRAKRELKTKLLYQTESCVGNCLDMAKYVLYNCQHRPPLYDRVCEIDRVTAKDLKEVCTDYIYTKDPVVVAVGPCEGLPDYNRLCSSMYWLRV